MYYYNLNVFFKSLVKNNKENIIAIGALISKCKIVAAIKPSSGEYPKISKADITAAWKTPTPDGADGNAMLNAAKDIIKIVEI